MTVALPIYPNSKGANSSLLKTVLNSTLIPFDPRLQPVEQLDVARLKSLSADLERTVNAIWSADKSWQTPETRREGEGGRRCATLFS